MVSTINVNGDILYRTDDSSKDSIAEPLYDLINEIYELHGMFKWLRKSFIAFVEVTFGRSINRYMSVEIKIIHFKSLPFQL